MGMSREDQQRIMREDQKRRDARDIADHIALHHPKVAKGVDPYHYSRSIRGVPSENNRTHRASVNCWERGMKSYHTVGVANPEIDTTPTVRVIRDGVETIVPASNFNKSRSHYKRTTSQNVDLLNKRADVAHVSAAQLAPIGNVE